MQMYVYTSKKPNPWTHQLVPTVIETNLAWAIPYWTRRKQQNPNISWKIS